MIARLYGPALLGRLAPRNAFEPPTMRRAWALKPGQPSHQASIMLDGARVLILEDEALIALNLADPLESAGAVVVGPAPSNRQALGMIDAGPLEAAILDVNLSDGEVTPVLERLVAQGTPVLIYSGRGPSDEMLRRHPTLSILRKPEAPERIVSELAALVLR